MVLRRDVAEHYHFRAPASEDLWYSLDLALDGLLPRHVESARLSSENAPNWHAASQQRQRYEAGRLGAAKEFLGPLLRKRSLATFEAAWFLASPPFAVAAVSLLAGLVLGAAAGSAPLVIATSAAMLALAAALITALVQSRAPGRTWLALLAAPWYVAWKLTVQVRAIFGLVGARATYGPTERAVDSSTPSRQGR